MTYAGVDRSTGATGTGGSSTALLADGSVALTADWVANEFDITAGGFFALEPGGPSKTGFQAPALAANVIYTLPVADAGVTGYVLSSNAAGILSWQPSSSSGGALNIVTQVAHGFSVGQLLYMVTTVYTLADKDAVSTAEVVGIVQAVTSADVFVIQTGGYIATLSGLTAGTVYFLGDSGALTATEPSTVGQVSKPVLVATATTAGYFINLRGSVVGSASSTLAVQNFSGDNSTVAFVLSSSPLEENTFVMVEGVYQQKNTYSISGSTLTFSVAPPTGTTNIEVVTVGAVAIGTPSDGTVTTAKIAAGGTTTLATMQATTSGTNKDFTGIPAGTKTITVMLAAVSSNGTGGFGVQLGTGGTPETTGYLSGYFGATTAGAAFGGATTASFAFANTTAAASFSGSITFQLMNAATNLWTCNGSIYADDATDYTTTVAGHKPLAGTLDMVRFLAGGADTFDTGNVNITYK
jgi:hypothetical protein